MMCLLDVASGMTYLHSMGILHGDLKSANVLLKSTATDLRGYHCKIADFGCARTLKYAYASSAFACVSKNLSVTICIT